MSDTRTISDLVSELSETKDRLRAAQSDARDWERTARMELEAHGKTVEERNKLRQQVEAMAAEREAIAMLIPVGLDAVGTLTEQVQSAIALAHRSVAASEAARAKAETEAEALRTALQDARDQCVAIVGAYARDDRERLEALVAGCEEQAAICDAALSGKEYT